VSDDEQPDGDLQGECAAEIHQLEVEIDCLRSALRDFLNIIDDSRGVAGYHLNGNVAEWGEFPEVDAARAALAGEVK